jgi:hypothetical protein
LDKGYRWQVRGLNVGFNAVQPNLVKGMEGRQSHSFGHEATPREANHTEVVKIGVLEALPEDLAQVHHPDDAAGLKVACDQADIRACEEPAEPILKSAGVSERLYPRLVMRATFDVGANQLSGIGPCDGLSATDVMPPRDLPPSVCTRSGRLGHPP